MPARLKTYVTTSGFFELAVAAPTMKAALEIWGAGLDLFRRGYAKETDEPAIIKATMSKPGTVLRRAVGSKGTFKQEADLPDVSSWTKPGEKSPPPKAPISKPDPASEKQRAANTQPKKPTAAEKAADRKMARLYEVAERKRKRDSARAEVAERQARERRKKAIQKADKALQSARAVHDERVVALVKERDALERRARDEEERWKREKLKLETVLQKQQA